MRARGSIATVVPIIRPATAADAQRVATIYIESWNAGFGGLAPTRGLGEEQVGRWVRELTGGSRQWSVALVDRMIVGFAGVGPSRDPVDAMLGELDTIGVAPDHWRRGVGTTLMAPALAALKRAGYREAIVWTWAGYARGRGFYERTGWNSDGGHRDERRQISFRQCLLEGPWPVN
jgi:GNAT superfamily N-acetyltransferase